MEYIEGKDLETVLDDEGTPGLAEKDVLTYSSQVLTVLAYLHEQDPPIIYRDIKPANIMLRKSDKRAMLIDFGIARSVQSTTQKTAIGTVGYTPVEQYRGEPDARSDLYALGATIYHLLTGEAPIPFQFEPIRNKASHVSERLESVLLIALGHEPDDRYNSAREHISRF